MWQKQMTLFEFMSRKCDINVFIAFLMLFCSVVFVCLIRWSIITFKRKVE